MEEANANVMSTDSNLLLNDLSKPSCEELERGMMKGIIQISGIRDTSGHNDYTTLVKTMDDEARTELGLKPCRLWRHDVA